MVKQKKQKRLLVFLLAVFLLAALLAGGYLICYLCLWPQQNLSDVNRAQQLYHQPAESNSAVSRALPSAEKSKNTLANVRRLNSDIVGWVRYPGTVIDYPVMCEPTGQRDFYLHHNYLKEKSNHGSIFLPENTEPLQAKSLLLYGHNMRDGQMFHCIAELTQEQLRGQPVIYFDTGSGPTAYKIFSYLKTNTQVSQGRVFNYTEPKLQTDADLLQFGYELAIRSVYHFPVDVQAGDQLLLLSTCSSEFTDFRSVLAARRVRSGEEQTVNAAAVVPSGQTLYPDCWYASHGGRKPVWPEKYIDAKKQNRLPWTQTTDES